MEQPLPNGARRNEDIALDLLKLIASTTQVIKPAASSAGFGAPSAPKSDDQIATLLDLYKRCLSAVQGK
jgi:hypothetical protein